MKRLVPEKDYNHIVHIRKEIYVIYIMILGLLTLLGCGFENDVSSSSVSPATKSSSVTLSWKAPTTDVNGMTLDDLAGYKIYYGVSSNNYNRSINVGHFTNVVISNLSPGRWCFAVTAYDASGNESKYSDEICKML